MNLFEVGPDQRIFTVYAGLTASGYELAQHVSPETDALIFALRALRLAPLDLEYFQNARTAGCAVNPYWPRAFLMVFTALGLSDTPPFRFRRPFDELAAEIMELGAVNPGEKTPPVFNWLRGLPGVCNELARLPGYKEAWLHYREIIEASREQYHATINTAVRRVVNKVGEFPSGFPTISVLPNPLQAPQVDDLVHRDNRIYLITSRVRAGSVVHELLHHVFDGGLTSASKAIGDYLGLLEPVLPDMMRLQYAWDHSLASWHRVFEENLMRAATIWVTRPDGDEGDSAGETETQSKSGAETDPVAVHEEDGFWYVRPILQCFEEEWSGTGNMAVFIGRCLERASEMERSF